MYKQLQWSPNVLHSVLMYDINFGGCPVRKILSTWSYSEKRGR